MTPSKNLQNNKLLVVVGSKNPVKIAAVKEAFEKVFSNNKIEVKGIDVDSGVSAQPMNDKESIQGGIKRAKDAMKASPADYAVGVEAGLQKIKGQWFTSGWSIILTKEGKMGIGSSISMEVPESMMKLIKQGIELGKVNDIVFKTQNSKHAIGMFGLMTNEAITRQSCYRDGTISALSRFIHPEFY